jgi:hypothetical protein
MRQANRIFETSSDLLTKSDLVTIQPEDLLQSRVFLAD